jgi:hypothetical protein
MLDVVLLEARRALARGLRRLANRIAGETPAYNGVPRKFGRAL